MTPIRTLLASVAVAAIMAASASNVAAQSNVTAQEIKLPAAPIFYDPTGGPDFRNVLRPDLAQCSLWYGGPAGTLAEPGVILPPVPPPGVHGLVAAGGTSACRRTEALAMLSANANGAFVRAMGYLDNAHNYNDGNGNPVRYGYDRAVFGGGFGLTRPNGSYLSFDANKNDKRNVLYAGAPLDTRFFNAANYAIKGRAVLDGGPLQAVRGSVLLTDWDRENDNFTYRPLVGPATFAQFDRKLWQADTAAEFNLGGIDWIAGADLRSDRREGTRFQAPTLAMPLRPQSPVLADAAVAQFGLMLDSIWRFGPERRLLSGIRLDLVQASLGGMDQTGFVTPGAGATPTPRALFYQYYGYTGSGEEREANLSANLRYEQDFDGGAGRWFAGVRRKLRTADPRERYFVSYTPPAGILRTWIGNPALDPEQHYLAETGASWSTGSWQFAVRGYADQVGDFILHDRAHGQAGIRLNNSANVFRNIDAFIAGTEGLVGYRFANGVFINGTVNWTYADNRTDGGRPIAQIPPLESSIRFGWADSVWRVESRVRMVATQTRTDAYYLTGSGDDGNGYGGFPGGFATVDLKATWNPRPNLSFTIGVENLFNKAYTEFIDRNDIDDPFVYNPLAAGRSFFARGAARF